MIGFILKRLNIGHMVYRVFNRLRLTQLEQALLAAESREEKVFYRKLINLKLQQEQEKVVEEILI